jgi:hypothetical protein
LTDLLAAQEGKLLIKEAIMQGHLNKFHFLCLCELVEQVTVSVTFSFNMELVVLKADREKKSFDSVDPFHFSHICGFGKQSVFYFAFLELPFNPCNPPSSPVVLLNLGLICCYEVLT